MRRGAARQPAVVAALLLVGAGSAGAAPIRGRLEAPPHEERAEQLGFTRTRVAGPSKRLEGLVKDTALFLKVEESLPIPKPEEATKIVVRGLRLVPDVAACAVDATVEIENAEQEPVTVLVGGLELRIDPGATRAYECTVGDSQRSVRVAEWPHVRGTVFVGEVGVAAAPDERGNFVMSAPNGKYELLVVGRDGVLTSRPVEVDGASVSIGTIDLTGGVAAQESGAP